jgi:hypothetical protein
MNDIFRLKQLSYQSFPIQIYIYIGAKSSIVQGRPANPAIYSADSRVVQSGSQLKLIRVDRDDSGRVSAPSDEVSVPFNRASVLSKRFPALSYRDFDFLYFQRFSFKRLPFFPIFPEGFLSHRFLLHLQIVSVLYVVFLLSFKGFLFYHKGFPVYLERFPFCFRLT